MTARNYSSNATATTLVNPITDTATSMVVAATTGFPAAPFILAVDPGEVTQELVLVTAIAGTTLTVTRGFDSTSATAHDAGAVVQHSHAAIDFREPQQHIAGTSGVHGVTGDVLGTTDAQVLTHKDLTSATNTFPSSLTTDTELATHAALASGVHGVAGTVVGTSDAQALSNKDLTDPTNTFPATLALSADLTAHEADTSTHGVTGDVVGTTDVQTLTNKTLDSPVLTGDVEVDGFVSTGPTRFDSSITMPQKIQAGSDTFAGFTAVDTEVVVHVDFDEPFVPNPPGVTCQPFGVTQPQNIYPITVANITTTGFDAYGARSKFLTGFQFTWIAIADTE